MTHRQHAVCEAMTLCCIDERGATTDVAATLTSSRQRPTTVALTFHHPAGVSRWVLQRALLSAGMLARAEDDEIAIYPSFDEDGRRTMAVLDLRSTGTRVVALADSRALKRFLEDSDAPPATRRRLLAFAAARSRGNRNTAEPAAAAQVHLRAG